MPISMNQVETFLNLMSRSKGDERSNSRWEEVAKPAGSPSETSILIVDFNTLVSDSLVDQFPKLKYVVSPTTGHTHLQADFAKRGITLITLKGEQEFLKTVWSVAEHTIYLITRLAKEIEPVKRIKGERLGIVGYGRVGRQVAHLATGLGMGILTVDKDSESWAWSNLFKNCAYVSIHVDENETSINLVNHDYLTMMKPSACLINTSRPSVLDEKSLSSMISQNLLRGAALDVTGVNWELYPNVILTNHTGGKADRILTSEFALTKLKEILGRRSVREV